MLLPAADGRRRPQAFAKGRWLGRGVGEVFAAEFQSETPEHYTRKIEAGAQPAHGLVRAAADTVRAADGQNHGQW